MTLRETHRLAAAIFAIPLLVMVTTGILLQLRQDVKWIQPEAQTAVPGLSSMNIDQVAGIAASVHGSEIKSWRDISSIVMNPEKGTFSVRTKGSFEIQVDGTTGAVLSAGPRRSSLIIGLHQGAFLSKKPMKMIFLAAGVALLGLWITGLVLFYRHWSRRNQGVAA